MDDFTNMTELSYSSTLAPNVTNVTLIASRTVKPSLSMVSQIILTLLYVTGVIGNISALIILFLRDKRRNRKHLFMLRCLALNDLIALLGMLVQMYVSSHVSDATSMRWFCSLRVAWRLFGLFSGCVAIVMAGERWLALTRPFLYQKQITYPVIVRYLLGLWVIAVVLSLSPIVGFGVYYGNGQCVRYREATEQKDIIYAYVFFAFGTLLCACIVWCNLAVSRALSRLGRTAGVIRRISRASSRAKPLLSMTAGPPPEVVATAEERAFSRLMAVLSISFVVCWMPQMISIPLAQYWMTLPETSRLARKLIPKFHLIADMLLCIHFTLDPYIYVLLRMRPRFQVLKPLCRVCRSGRSRSSSFTGTIDQQMSSADPPTPITEAPSTPVSEEAEPHLLTSAAAV